MLAAFFGSNRAGLARRFFLLVLFRFWLMSSFTPLIGVAGLSFIPLPWAFFLMYGNNGLLDFLLVAGQLYTLWRLVKTLRKTASDSEPSNLPRISDTWQVILFGTETRVQPLLNALLIATAMRAVWLAINVDDPSGMILLWAFIPWPWSMYSTIVWVIEVLFVLYQLRTALMVVRLLLLERAPNIATVLGLTKHFTDDAQHPTPRHSSWVPTALQFCASLVLTCCAVTWICLMFKYGWVPFDYFMGSYYASYAILVGAGLSALGFIFGGRYIAGASGDVSTSFGVTTVPEDHWLAQRVHGLADQLNLPRPAVGTTTVLNAFAIGADKKTAMVVIGQPLLNYDKDELDAIIGHELGHILHNDVARMQFAEGFQRMLGSVVNVLTVMGATIVASAAKTRSGAQIGSELASASGTLVRQTVFVASELMAKGISRAREYHADEVGAHVTTPDAMARALKRIHGVAEKPTVEEDQYGYLMFRGIRLGRFFSTHPTLEARLQALDGHKRAKKDVATAPLEGI